MHHVDIHLEKDIYAANNQIAKMNADLFRSHNVRAFDLLGAIGSGKTALIERAIPLLERKACVPVPSPEISTGMMTTAGSWVSGFRR